MASKPAKKLDKPKLTDLSRLERANSITKRQLRQVLREYHEMEENLRVFIQEVSAITPAARVYTPSRKSETRVTAVGLWGDWHIGQEVQADEVEGMNSYNYERAVVRMRKWCKSFLKWLEVQRQAYPIDDIHILGLGDFVNGLIHLENMIYDEFETPVAVVKAAALAAECLATLAPHCKTLTASFITTDNHSRLTQKTMMAGRGKWSFGYLFNALVEAYIRDHKNILFSSHPVIKAVVPIAGKNFLVEHGNDVRAWMGIPFYSIERLRQREVERRAAQAMPNIDYLVLGHFHTYATWKGVIMNGALCGTTPYDHAAARHAWPSQVGFLVHPEHGLFNFTPFQLEADCHD